LFAAAALGCVGAVVIWRKLTPMIAIRAYWCKLRTLRQLVSFGSWVVVDAIGTLLFLNTDLLVVNRLLGAEATGQYAAILSGASLLWNSAIVLASVFAPTMTLLYSRQDIFGLIACSKQSVRFVGLLMAIPIGLICGLSKPLLRLWLGDAFVPLAPLIALMTSHLCINLAVLPLCNIQTASNHVRIPGIVSCVLGLLNLVLAILLAGPVGWGLYGVAAGSAIALTAKNLFFTPIYATRILGLKWTTYYHEIIPVAAATLGLAVLGWAVASWLVIHSWLTLMLVALMLASISVAFIFAVLLGETERAYVMRILCPWSSQAA